MAAAAPQFPHWSLPLYEPLSSTYPTPRPTIWLGSMASAAKKRAVDFETNPEESEDHSSEEDEDSNVCDGSDSDDSDSDDSEIDQVKTPTRCCCCYGAQAAWPC